MFKILNQNKMTDLEQNTLIEIERNIFEGKISNECLVEIFKLSAQYLGVCSIKKYAEENKITPQAIYKSRKYFEINDLKFVINNL